MAQAQLQKTRPAQCRLAVPVPEWRKPEQCRLVAAEEPGRS